MHIAGRRAPLDDRGPVLLPHRRELRRAHRRREEREPRLRVQGLSGNRPDGEVGTGPTLSGNGPDGEVRIDPTAKWECLALGGRRRVARARGGVGAQPEPRRLRRVVVRLLQRNLQIVTDAYADIYIYACVIVFVCLYMNTYTDTYTHTDISAAPAAQSI